MMLCVFVLRICYALYDIIISELMYYSLHIHEMGNDYL